MLYYKNNTNTEGKQMKMILTVVLIFGGLALMAGSAGDCDGSCGPGNDLVTMMKIAGAGLVMFISGAYLAITESAANE